MIDYPIELTVKANLKPEHYWLNMDSNYVVHEFRPIEEDDRLNINLEHEAYIPFGFVNFEDFDNLEYTETLLIGPDGTSLGDVNDIL